MLRPGTEIDNRFEIVCAIGGGGFGSVYKANQKQLDRVVAIKMLSTTLLQEPDGLPRFEREAKAIDSVKHKNIVGFYAYGIWLNAPYMVMELIEGISLEELLSREGRLEPMRSVRLIKQVLEALSCAHLAGVVHRDLKPSNIMVVDAGLPSEHVKIIDFGLAKLMSGYGVPGQKLTETGYAVGSCHYMAPEQAVGGQIDQRSDIYAAGCILYQMLCGRVPFDADNSIAIMFMHINEEPSLIGPQLPDDPQCKALANIVDNCMAKDPDVRYQHCSEVLSDVHLVECGNPTGVEPHLVRGNIAKFQSKSPKHIKLAMAALAAMLGCCAFAAYRILEHENKRVAEQYSISSVELNRKVQAEFFKNNFSLSQSASAIEEVLNRDRSDHRLPTTDRFCCFSVLANRYALLYISEHDRTKAKMFEDYAHRYANKGINLYRMADYPHADHPDQTFHALLELASALRALHRPDAASIYSEILNGRAKRVPLPEVCMCREALGSIYIEAGKYAQAESELNLAREAHELCVELALAGSGSLELWERGHCGNLRALADLYCLKGKFSNAKSLYQRICMANECADFDRYGAELGLCRIALVDDDYSGCALHAKTASHFSERAFKNDKRSRSFDAQLFAITASAGLSNQSEMQRLMKELEAQISTMSAYQIPALSHLDTEMAYVRLAKLNYAGTASSVARIVSDDTTNSIKTTRDKNDR